MDEPTVSDVIATHLARGALYTAGAAAFSYPTDQTLDDLTDKPSTRGLQSAGARLGLSTEVAAFIEAAGGVTAGDLAGAYDALFGVPIDGTYAVVPYEAHYTIGDDIGQQQRRIAAIVGLLRTVGLEPSRSFDERQDHVVVELELMQVLAGQHASAKHEDDKPAVERIAQIETTVLGEHLIGFVPAFAHDVRSVTTCQFYKAASQLIEQLVQADYADRPATDSPAPTHGEVAR